MRPIPRSDEGDIDADKVSAGQPDDDEDIEQIEANGRKTNKTMAAMSGAWLRRKVRHPGTAVQIA